MFSAGELRPSGAGGHCAGGRRSGGAAPGAAVRFDGPAWLPPSRTRWGGPPWPGAAPLPCAGYRPCHPAHRPCRPAHRAFNKEEGPHSQERGPFRGPSCCRDCGGGGRLCRPQGCPGRAPPPPRRGLSDPVGASPSGRCLRRGWAKALAGAPPGRRLSVRKRGRGKKGGPESGSEPQKVRGKVGGISPCTASAPRRRRWRHRGCSSRPRSGRNRPG